MVGADQFHVKVRFRVHIMTFFVNPDEETVKSLMEKIAQRIQRPAGTLRLLSYHGINAFSWMDGIDTTLTGCGIRNGQCLEVLGPRP